MSVEDKFKEMEERIKEIENKLIIINSSVNILLNKHFKDDDIKIFVCLCKRINSLFGYDIKENLVLIDKFKCISWTNKNIKDNICYMNELLKLLNPLEYNSFNKEVNNYLKSIDINVINQKNKEKLEKIKNEIKEDIQEEIKNEMKDDIQDEIENKIYNMDDEITEEIKAKIDNVINKMSNEKEINDNSFTEMKIELFFDILTKGLDEDTIKELMKLKLLERNIRFYCLNYYDKIREYFFSLKWNKQNLKNNLINVLEKIRNTPQLNTKYADLKNIFDEIDNNDYKKYNELNNFGFHTIGTSLV